METGALIQVKNSYKVSADAKKEIAPKKPVSAVAKAKVKKVRAYVCNVFVMLALSDDLYLPVAISLTQTTSTKKTVCIPTVEFFTEYFQVDLR